MTPNRKSETFRVALAVLPPLAALTLQWVFLPYYGSRLWMLFYPAVFLSSWIGGLYGGLASTAISVAFVLCFFAPPEFLSNLEDPDHFLQVAIFVGMGVLFSVFHDRLRKTNRQAKVALDGLSSVKGQAEAMVEAASEPIVVADREGRITLVNARTEAVFGYSREELLGQSIEMLVPDKDRAQHVAFRNRFSADPKRRPMGTGRELHARRKDGSEFPVEISLSPLVTSKGTHVTSAIVDITERVHATKALRESERRYTDILDNVQLIAVMLDRESRITYCNDFLLRLTGWQREEVIGKDWFELFLPSPHEELRHVFEQLLAGHPSAKHHENEIFTRSRERRLIQWSNTTLRSVSGDVTGTASIGGDITERKVAEKKILGLNRVYSVLSGINTLIVHAKDRETLYREACNIAYRAGHFPFVWVGIANPDTQIFDAVAWAGDRSYASLVRRMPGGTRSSRIGLAASAFATKKPFLCDDIEADGEMLVHPEQALALGYRSAIALPLIVDDSSVGALVLYADVPHFFDPQEIALLDEMAGDISFALVNFSREEARLEAEKALMASEKRYRSIYQNLQDVYIESGLDGTIFGVNSQIEVLSHGQYKRDDVIGRSTDMFQPDPARREAFFKALTQEGAVRDFEATFINRDGSRVECSISALLLPGTTGKQGTVFATVRDITLRKQAEEALRAAEEQFRSLVEQSIAGICIIQDGVYAYVNPRFAEIFGYDSYRELLGRDPASLAAEKDRAKVKEHIRLRIEGKVRTVDYTATALRKDGSTIEIGVRSSPLLYRGRPAVVSMLQDISEKQRAEEQIKRYIVQLQNAFMQTVEVATTMGEMRDPYTHGHERRVAEIGVAIGVELGFDALRLEGLRVIGYLHDIGKITVPSEILSKPGKLNAAEFALIKGHPQAGFDILKGVEFPWPVAQVVLQHHERLDGSGYPQGLKGDEIMLEARVLAVADTVEAMSSHRPYRPGLGIENGLAEIERGRGTLYEPLVVGACLQLFREKGFVLPSELPGAGADGPN